MVDQPYYEASVDMHGASYPDLRRAINTYGHHEADRYAEKYDRTDIGHTDIDIGRWAGGPLLTVTQYDSDGNVEPPTLASGIVTAIANAGYVPWGFRPETDVDGETEAFLWYLRPIADVRDENSGVFDSEYVLEHDDGSVVRTDDGDAVTFDSREAAEAIGVTSEGDVDVVERPT